MPDPVIRTVYEVEIFSRGDYDPPSRDDDPFGLLAINYDIVEGDCVGNVTLKSHDEVAADELVDELVRIGNDGTFFEPIFETDEAD